MKRYAIERNYKRLGEWIEIEGDVLENLERSIGHMRSVLPHHEYRIVEIVEIRTVIEEKSV